MQIAILISVENYADTSIPTVKFAEADAVELADALVPHGFCKADRVLLVNTTATKTIIESRIRKTIATLNEDDTLYFYYAGHGFSKNNLNYITCHDTQLADLEATSIPLDSIFNQLRQSKCKRIVMFLDSCESGMLMSADMRGIYSELTEDEIKEFFEGSDHCVCYSACKTGEKSWSSGHLKHGIWTFHLIEAFKGDVQLALEKGRYLTSNSLQNHLKNSVPRTLRTTFADRKVQTPWVYGAHNGEFPLADFHAIFERRNAASNPNASQVTRVTFVRQKIGQVRSLSGFQKRHRIPDEVNSTTAAFVAKIGNKDVEDNLDEIHESLVTIFRFKRADIQVDHPEFGHATIITPYFNYTIDLSQNPNDPTEVVWRFAVSDIKEPEQILSEAFERVFGKLFDRVEFVPQNSIDVPALIDRVQELDDDRLSITFDRGATWCSLSVEGESGQIRITASTFEIVKQTPEPPKQLLESFFAIQRTLIDTHEVRLIQFSD